MPQDFSTSTEREALAGFLDYQRDALVGKVTGLSDAEARRSPTVSSMSLLGLLKHSAAWEARWFQEMVPGNRRRPGSDRWVAGWRTHAAGQLLFRR